METAADARARGAGIVFRNILIEGDCNSNFEHKNFDDFLFVFEKIKDYTFLISRNNGYYITSCGANFIKQHIPNFNYKIDFDKIVWEGILQKDNITFLKSEEISFPIERWKDKTNFRGYVVISSDLGKTIERIIRDEENGYYKNEAEYKYFISIYIIDKEYVEGVPFCFYGGLTKAAR